MKNLLLFLFIISSATAFSQMESGSKKNNQTEEYAIINAFTRDNKFYISTTIGSTKTNEVRYEKDLNKEGKQKFDKVPIIKEMERLNKLGFKLFQSSTSVFPKEQNSYMYGELFYEYIFVKKVL